MNVKVYGYRRDEGKRRDPGSMSSQSCLFRRAVEVDRHG